MTSRRVFLSSTAAALAASPDRAKAADRIGNSFTPGDAARRRAQLANVAFRRRKQVKLMEGFRVEA